MDVLPTEEELTFGRGRGQVRDLGRRGWGVILVVAALAAAALWYLNRPAPQPPLIVTYSGRVVDNAAEVIARADTAFAGYVDDNHGARSAKSRCYFNRIAAPASTDVALTVFCGPALFYAGAAPELWLRYVLSPSDSPGPPAGHTRLIMTDHPETRALVALPVGAQLERPDHHTVPNGADGLVAPGPPPIDRTAAAVAVVKSTDLPRLPVMPRTSIIVSRDVSVRLKASGFVPSFGRGPDLRIAPAGEKLLAFELRLTQGEVGELDSSDPPGQPPLVGVAVDGGAAERVPIQTYVEFGTETARARFVVAAVPANAQSVDLVVVDDGVAQRLSLLDGAPGVDNVAILTRDPRQLDGRATSARTALARVHRHGRTFTTPIQIYASTPILGYFSLHGPEHAGGPDRALLTLTIYFQTPRIRCPGSACGFSFRAHNFTLEPTGGQPIRANAAGDVTTGVFDVPATFSAGTVTVVGSTHAAGSTVTLIHPYRVRVSFTN